MATKNLEFTKNADGDYIATFTSEGASVVELERSKQGVVMVYAAIPGMTPIYIGGYMSPHSASQMIDINVLHGLEIKIVSKSEVSDAKVMTA